LRTRIALRDPRDVAGADEREARVVDDELALRRGPGAGSGRRQIGQFSTKRLWRQKLGGTTAQSRRRTFATSPAL
jgi:hypothetical protein